MSASNNKFERFLSTFHYFPSISLYKQTLATCSYFCLTLFQEKLSTPEHTYYLKFPTKNDNDEVAPVLN